MHRIVLFVVVAGCLLPPANNLHGGETLYIARDSWVLEVMGDGLHTEDHRAHSHATPLPVVPVGATVKVAADYEQQRSLMAPNAPLANHNPWVLVEVIDSPVTAQRGWRGWIHLDTTTALPVAAVSIAGATVAKPSVVCPYADANDFQCSLSVAADTPVRVLGCSGPQVELELWTTKGLYLHGFVKTSQFTTPPCAVATKEAK